MGAGHKGQEWNMTYAHDAADVVVRGYTIDLRAIEHTTGNGHDMWGLSRRSAPHTDINGGIVCVGNVTVVWFHHFVEPLSAKFSCSTPCVKGIVGKQGRSATADDKLWVSQGSS